MRRAILTALVLLATAPLPTPAHAQRGDRWEGVRELIRGAMREHELPSIAVAVAKDGRVLWEEAFGWADVQARVPATPQTMYSLASISKPMTATAIMRLVEQGRVDLDRPVDTYLGGVRLTGLAGDPTGATVRRVLSHTAGLPLHYEFFYEGEDHPRRTTDEGIARYAILVNPPGEVYAYSNLGYGILDRIIERASGRDYADYMRDEVFLPLGMTRSTVSTGANLQGAALRYDSEGRPIPPYDFDHRGGSAVYSSVQDLVRFGTFHLGERMRGQQRILQDRTIERMQQVATPGDAGEGYGLGWFINTDHGHRRVSHTGGMPGVATVLNLYPDQDVVVAVVTNTSNRVVNRVAQEIAAVVLPGYAASLRAAGSQGDGGSPAPFAAPPELLGRWSGTLRTYEGEAPLALEFQPDGDVHVRLGEELETLLNDVSYRGGVLSGRFAGSVPTADARRHAHLIALNLRLRDGRLAGQAAALTTTDTLYFALSSYAELSREPPR